MSASRFNQTTKKSNIRLFTAGLNSLKLMIEKNNNLVNEQIPDTLLILAIRQLAGYGRIQEMWIDSD
jgi:hypothetical protein